MKKGKIVVVGIGPGGEEDITPSVREALKSSDVVIGYDYYFQFIQNLLSPDTICVDAGMKKERERANVAFEYAESGNIVCIISSGDAGIYGMAPLAYEMKNDKNSDIEISVLPGISAFQKAASLLGAPIGHDFCVISLSDLLTPWDKIEQRIIAASKADFVTTIYNPRSKGRYWQLHRFKELFLKDRSPETPIGFVRQAGRENQKIITTTLSKFNPNDADMFTVIIVGNSQTYFSKEKMITPRGYYADNKSESGKIGQDIMIRSFQTIESELQNKEIPLDKKWALLHAIHTTADFNMENILHVDENAVKNLYQSFSSKKTQTIISDVTMVISGIRKGALQRMNIEAKCYLHDPRVAEMAKQKGITRTQAGIKLAVKEHPDALYVFGNAPTALIELSKLIHRGEAKPAGVIAAPVGFVNVKESKHMVKPFSSIPKIIVEGRKGGSNLAATLVNSILTYDDAENLKPGRDV